MDKERRKQHSIFSGISLVIELGFMLSVPIAGGAIIGSWLDVRFSSKPTLTLLLLAGGIIISFYNFMTTIKRFIKKSS